MSTIRLLMGIGSAVLCLPCPAQERSAAPWSELLSQAIANNRELMAIRQRSEEAQGLLRQAGVRPAFTLDASGATGRPLGTKGEEQYGAGLSRTIETAGKRTLRVRVAEKQLALAGIEFDERVRQLRFEIRLRYAEFAAEWERRKTLDGVRESYGRSLALMKARVEQGDAAALERDLLVVELSRTEALREMTGGRLEAARAELARLASLPDSRAVREPELQAAMRTDFDLAELKGQGLGRRPDWRAAAMVEQQTEAEIALAQAQGHADVTMSAGYSRVYSRFDDQFGLTPSDTPVQLRDRDDVLSVGVSVPLFGKSRNLGNVEAAVARSRAARYRREFLERSIPLEVEGAWQRMRSAQQAYRTMSETVLRQSEKNLEVIRRAYELGQLRLLDVLNEQRRLLETQLAGIEGKLEVMRALAELERATGGELQ